MDDDVRIAAPGEASDRGGDLSSPISRAFHLLDIVAAAGGPVRFADIQKSTALPKATLSRLLRQLETEGMLAFEPQSQRYRLGLRLIRLAHGAWQSASIVAVARQVIDALAHRFGTTVHLATLDNAQVLYLDKRVPRPTIDMFSAPGRIGPAYCTGVGKAMLAFLPEEQRRRSVAAQSFIAHTPKTITSPDALERELEVIRSRGYALDDEEHERTVICVALPIVASDGAVLGAVSVTSTTHMTNLDRLSAGVPEIRRGVEEIARGAEMQMLNR